MSREEHLAWCKARALELCEHGHFAQAVASMISDMGKSETTAFFLEEHRIIGMRALARGNHVVMQWIRSFE